MELFTNTWTRELLSIFNQDMKDLGQGELKA